MKNIIKYKAMVLSCMDPRFQKPVHDYLKKQKLSGKYSSFTIAGAAIGVAHPKFKKWHSVFLDNLSTSIALSSRACWVFISDIVLLFPTTGAK